MPKSFWNQAAICERLLEVRLAAGQQRAAQLAGDAAAQAYQPFAVGGQQLLVDPRLEVKPLQEGRRRELHEISEARRIAGQKRQVVAGLFRASRLLMESAARGDVRLHAEDRVDAQFLGGLVELDRPVQISMIGQRQGRHSQGLRPFEQTSDGTGAVQQAVVAMTMQMGERKCAHGFLRVASVGLITVFYPRRSVARRTPLFPQRRRLYCQ